MVGKAFTKQVNHQIGLFGRGEPREDILVQNRVTAAFRLSMREHLVTAAVTGELFK